MSTTVGNREVIQFRVDFDAVRDAMKAAPSTCYFWLRNYLGGLIGQHRKSWLQQKGTKFGRGDSAGRAIKVFGVNEGPPIPQDNHVVYNVTPKDVRFQDPVAASNALRQLASDISTGSVVLRVHQTGEDIATPSWMAIPIRTRPGSPDAWRKKYPNKTLVTRTSKKDAGTLLLFERTRVGKRGRPKAGSTGRSKRVRLQLRFLLKHRVDMKPTLLFYESWDRLKSARDASFKTAADRILKDWENGIVT